MYIISPPHKKKDKDEPHHQPLDDLTEGERSLLQFKHFKTADQFTKALWTLLFLADANDLEKMSKVYPSHVEAYYEYKRVPGWFENLVSRYPIHSNG